jgi:hypothetical protein
MKIVTRCHENHDVFAPSATQTVMKIVTSLSYHTHRAFEGERWHWVNASVFFRGRTDFLPVVTRGAGP